MTNTSKPITAEQPAPGEDDETRKPKKPNPSKPITEEQPRADPNESRTEDE
ncbi:hypothetical protein [Zhengella mangrovi]|uniref:hypothetical protein n=1 Tax=Zhengella mangrovi TaxID=1982044 RepID=UPI0013FD3673|nr:hypothetical protein [Zhengella mangrovi]